jgi:hypothetical protein
VNANDTGGIDPAGFIGLAIPIPSLWSVAGTEVSRPAAEVRPHADLFSCIENIEQPVEGGERLFPQFLSQLTLDGSDRVSLSLEISGPRDGEGYGFLSSTRRRIGD